MNSRKLPDYERPPLAEVVMGVKFQPLPGIMVPHYGLFWGEVKKEFTTCQNAPVLGDLKELEERETGGLPIPRVWLINEGGDYLIQLQKNHFFFNWRKRDGVYPRFDNIVPKFNENFEKFQKFCAQNNLGDIVPQRFELSYINHIFINEGWTKIEDIGKIFPDITWRENEDRYLKGMISAQWFHEFNLASSQNGRILVKIRHGEKRPEKIPLIVFEITVRGSRLEISQEVTQEEWFKTAHDTILLTFEDLTSQSIQEKVWKKKNGK